VNRYSEATWIKVIAFRRHNLLSVSAEIARNAAPSSVDKSDPGDFSGVGAATGLKKVKVGCTTTWKGSDTPSDTGPSMLISVLILRRCDNHRVRVKYSEVRTTEYTTLSPFRKLGRDIPGDLGQMRHRHVAAYAVAMTADARYLVRRLSASCSAGLSLLRSTNR
jgi:hypothetical protein